VEKWADSIPFARLLTIFIPPLSRKELNGNPLGALAELADKKEARKAIGVTLTTAPYTLKRAQYTRIGV